MNFKGEKVELEISRDELGYIELPGNSTIDKMEKQVLRKYVYKLYEESQWLQLQLKNNGQLIINNIENSEITPVIEAEKRGNFENVRNKNPEDHNGMTPLPKVNEFENLDNFGYINTRSKNGHTTLLQADECENSGNLEINNPETIIGETQLLEANDVHERNKSLDKFEVVQESKKAKNHSAVENKVSNGDVDVHEEKKQDQNSEIIPVIEAEVTGNFENVNNKNPEDNIGMTPFLQVDECEKIGTIPPPPEFATTTVTNEVSHNEVHEGNTSESVQEPFDNVHEEENLENCENFGLVFVEKERSENSENFDSSNQRNSIGTTAPHEVPLAISQSEEPLMDPLELLVKDKGNNKTVSNELTLKSSQILPQNEGGTRKRKSNIDHPSAKRPKKPKQTTTTKKPPNPKFYCSICKLQSGDKSN